MNKRQRKKNFMTTQNIRRLKFIHYGNDIFDPTRVKNGAPHYKKPSGLWASPIGTDNNWKNYCLSEEWHMDRLAKHFRFRVKKSAKILVVNCLQDVAAYMDETYSEMNREKPYQDYDGMLVWMSNSWNELHNNSFFWQWDVDSLVIWNPDMIQIL